MTAVFETLVAGKSDQGFFQYLVENLNTVLVPVNNVDGFIQAQAYPVNVTADREQPREGRMRRKNLRNPVTDGTIDAGSTTCETYGVTSTANRRRIWPGKRKQLESNDLTIAGTEQNSTEVLAFRRRRRSGLPAPRFYSDSITSGRIT